MKTLIVGGEGYVGSYLSRYLNDNGIEVSTYGNRQNDYNLLSVDYLQKYEYVILLAGNSSVLSCAGELKSPWNNNVRNFSNLITKTHKKHKIIYASSSSVYGNKGEKIYNENDFSLDFVNNYDLTKISLDLVAKERINAGRKIIGFRFGTVNGGSSVLRRDLMINSMVYSALTGGAINVNNKHVSRPLLALNDLSRAMHRVIIGDFHSGIYNLASFNSTVDEISQLVKKHTGVDIIDKGDYNGIYDFNTDTTKFQQVYDFKFKETVESITEDVIDCYKNRNPIIVARDKYFDYAG
jgi:nucleoside-diphosphate-sugar epimerase